ncbi:MAG: NADH-quinone oxidoreductase subunit N [Parachlamydiaceae bacterium]
MLPSQSLSLSDFLAMSPLVILLCGALLVLLVESFFEVFSKRFSFHITIVTIVLALWAALYAPVSHNALLTPWLRFDTLARFFDVLFLGIGLASAFLTAAFFKNFEASRGEYYFLLLSSLFGLLLIGYANDFLMIFLGIETVSIATYVLCGYMKEWKLSHEAALKYFFMGALATAFFLYGIALVYGAVGTTGFHSLLADYKKLSAVTDKALFLAGIAFITTGLAFKASVVPFHVWAPDVYEGAPTPVTAFMAVGIKAGAFAAFAIIFLQVLPQFSATWSEAASFLVYPTLIYANIVALRQVCLRRFFAYSGISHAGFLLIPVIVGTPDALSALKFYLVVYSIATLGAFAVIAFLDKRSQGVVLHDLFGLFRRAPLLAAILSLCVLTLAGIPPTVGFFAKFYVLKVAYQAGYYPLVFVGLLTAILAAYYYLRIIGVMFSEMPTEAKAPKYSWAAAAVGLVSFAALIILSFYPAPLLT